MSCGQESLRTSCCSGVNAQATCCSVSHAASCFGVNDVLRETGDGLIGETRSTYGTSAYRRREDVNVALLGSQTDTDSIQFRDLQEDAFNCHTTRSTS